MMLRKLSFRSTLVLHWSCLRRKSKLLLVRHQVWRLKRKESSSKVLEMQSQVKPSMLKERLRLLSHHCCVILPPLPPLDISIFKSTTQDNRKWPRNKKLFKKKKEGKGNDDFSQTNASNCPHNLKEWKNDQTRHLCFFITEKSLIHHYWLKKEKNEEYDWYEKRKHELAGSITMSSLALFEAFAFLYIGERELGLGSSCLSALKLPGCHPLFQP